MWRYDCMCVVCDDGFRLSSDVFFPPSLVGFFWLSFWNVHILLWSPQTFVTAFPANHSLLCVRSVGGLQARTQNCTHWVDFTRALTFQPTNLILLANSIGCALMLLPFTNSFINLFTVNAERFFLSLSLSLSIILLPIFILHTFYTRFAHFFIS